MKYFILFLGLLFVVAFPLYAQEWTPQDSLHLRRFLSGEGEVRLNPDVLKEIGIDSPLGSPKEDMNKSWLEFDSSLPVMPQMPEKKVVLTLRPYTANTKYNWDPVYQKKITVNKNTWRSSPFYELTKLKIYTNWAKRPLDAGPRESVWRGVGGGGISGDFMAPFTKDFWNIKGRKRRARTLEVLKTYGDSISVRRNDAIIK